MKESIGTALSWIKTNAFRMGLLPVPRSKAASAVTDVVRVLDVDSAKS